jgi:hypothetical protein
MDDTAHTAGTKKSYRCRDAVFVLIRLQVHFLYQLSVRRALALKNKKTDIFYIGFTIGSLSLK